MKASHSCVSKQPFLFWETKLEKEIFEILFQIEILYTGSNSEKKQWIPTDSEKNLIDCL